MSTAVVFAIYFILWWLSLLIVLPWGAHSQDESGDITPGTDPGAPSMHRVKGKLVWATAIATVLFADSVGGLCGRAHSRRCDRGDQRPAPIAKRHRR